MRLHLDLSCVRLNKTADQLRNTQEQLHHTQTELHYTQEKFEKITRKLEEKVIALENKLMQCSEEHTWKISGISELLRQLIEGKTPWFTRISAPFYTRKYGYNFKIELSYKYHSDFYRFYLAVCFILMKGECNATLPWPFNEKVTFTLISQQENQNESENIVGFIPANPCNSSWNQKPLLDEYEKKCLDKCLVPAVRLTGGRFWMILYSFR